MKNHMRNRRMVLCLRLVLLLLVLLSILTLALPGVFAQEGDEETDDFNEAHCTIGAMGIALVVLILVVGFIVSGRLTGTRHPRLKPFHKYSTLVMTVFFTGQSVWGLFMLQWLFITDPHGYLGISIPIVAWLNIGVSPCVAKKIISFKHASLLHVLLSFVLLILVILQVTYGYLFLE